MLEIKCMFEPILMVATAIILIVSNIRIENPEQA